MSNDAAVLAQRPLPPQPTEEATCAGPPTAEASCQHCPLRQLDGFAPVRADELLFIDGLKRAELDFAAGATLVRQGADEAPLYTLLEGWALRCKRLPDGRRQVLDVLLPGDFIGLQQRMTDSSQHAVQALTAVRVCAFARDAVRRIHERLPSLAFDLTWLAARGESVVDEHLLNVGRRSARERLAALLLMLWLRAVRLPWRAADGSIPFPLRQRDLADALGLSLVHTNRQWRALRRDGLIAAPGADWLRIDDPQALAAAAMLRWPITPGIRPLI